MRISDWSSDVCSSDLIELGRDAFVGDAVYVDRAGVDLALGIDVAMEVVLRRPAIAQLDAADLDDAMAEIDFKSGRFGIENDLPAHVASSTTDEVAISTPSLPSRSAPSLPGSPVCPLTPPPFIRQ